MKATLSIILFFSLTFIVKNNFAFGSDSTVTKDVDSTKYGINFKRTEVMPSYPGGVIAMIKYLKSNLKYPIEAKKKKLEGMVKVKFTIDQDGSVKEPIVLKDGVGGGADEEAIRLVGSMPNWNPGTQGGKPVKVYYILPVSFKLK